MHALAVNSKKKNFKKNTQKWQTKPPKASTANSGTPNSIASLTSTPQDAADPSLRPNQIFAASLDFCMLDKERCRSVVEVVQSSLVTPYGLRTLSFDDPKFRGNVRWRTTQQRQSLP
jgi:predicted glycogen debranching enzyme